MMTLPRTWIAAVAASWLLAATPAQAQDKQGPTRVDSITGSVQILELATKALPGPRTLRVYLPPGYQQEVSRRYPVLYLHDGQNVFSGLTSFLPNGEWKADEAAQALIEAGLIEPIVIVAIDNAGARRADEYLPTRAKVDGREMGGEADRYGKLLVEEIKPHIDATFRTKRDARNTAVGGSSLGGVISLYLGLTYPQVFGKLALLSPSLWWDSKVMLEKVRALDARQLGKRRPQIWLDTGTSEGSGEGSGEAVTSVRELSKLLQGRGWKPGKDLAVYVEGYAIHREDAWARRMPVILLYLFGRK
ncbi:MAG TPA: alpha/beta hydrolase-fold protein [Kofleriaceae bacterium]|nr:alpha/beta hydrolase-fold protein [Kofleriaceae bacterium]